MTLSPARGLMWAALSFGSFVMALFAVLLVSAMLGRIWDAPHAVVMAAWAMISGVLSVLLVLVAAQLAFGAWLRPHPVGVAIAAVGIGLATILQVTLLKWEIARFGYPDPEYVGWTAGLFAVLIGLAVAAFAAFLVPRRVMGWPVAAVLLGFAGVAFIVTSNVTGLEDGIAPASWPLAAVIGLCGVYAAVTVGLVVRRALDRSGGVL